MLAAEKNNIRKRSISYTIRVPGAHDDASVCGVVFDLVNDLCKLIDSLTHIVRVTVLVLGAKVSPLESIDGAEIADLAMTEADLVQILARAIALPDVDALLGEVESVGVALDEPEQLLDDGTVKDALGREEGKDVVLEGEAHGRGGKDRTGTGAGAVSAVLAVVDDVANHVQVLMLLMLVGSSPWMNGWGECGRDHAEMERRRGGGEGRRRKGGRLRGMRRRKKKKEKESRERKKSRSILT